MPKGWLSKHKIRENGKTKTFFKLDGRRIVPDFAEGFSPVLSPGDALWVRYEGSADNPGKIYMALPDKPVPYTFVPVVIGEDQPSPKVFDAVFHDGRPGLLTGELRCKLEALTPLFVGHHQYSVEQREDVEAVTENGDPNSRLQPTWGDGLGDRVIAPDKTFREPLFIGGDLPSKARVVIPGSSIKGMVRHNIGAIFGAPMERVEEQYFSYRPNLQIGRGKYETREAIVTRVDLADTRNPVLKLKILLPSRHAYYMTKSIFKQLNYNCGDEFNIAQLLPDLCQVNWTDNRGRIRTKHRIGYSGNQSDNNLLPSGNEFKLLRYKAGIDGNGEVATTLQTNGKKKDDVAVIVAIDQIYKSVDHTVDKEIIRQFLKTKKELTSKKYGHAKRKGDIDSYLENIKNPNLETDQLIYVEMDQHDNVVSFGHNFRYRWRYADSVLMKNRGQKKMEYERVEVASPDLETMNEDGGRLTGARLLFGYVDGSDEQSSDASGSRDLDIAEDKNSDAVRLAGRIAINAALEQCGDPSDLAARFIHRKAAENMAEDDPHRYTIPLKILGAPKASAVEHYIHQPDKNMKTYGDLPGISEDKTAGRLNGRKFYRHQKNAAKNHSLFEDSTADNIATNQSAFVQFITKPGSTFRFTVRFKELRDWELGALILALCPQLEDPKAANKLGHGRPLGLGSVRISIDKLRLLKASGCLEDADETAEHYLERFRSVAQSCKLEEHIKTWLQVLNYDDSTEAAYPNESGHIYTYHTHIRATYSKKRRSGQPMPENFGDPVKP